MVFFAFHHYLVTKFHLNNFFCWELHFCPICYLKWCISVYIVSNISQVILVFVYWGYLWGYLDKKEATIFHIYGQKIFSHKAIWLKFRPSFTKLLRNLIIIFICEKTRLQQLRKIKYSILASILHIFQNFFLAEPHTHLHNALCKSHDFLIFCFESWHTFQKLWLFGKIHFVILFCTYKI